MLSAPLAKSLAKSLGKCLAISLPISLAAGTLSAPLAFAQADSEPLYRDANAATALRVEDLLSTMTLEEKIAQITTVWNDKQQFLDEDMRLDADALSRLHPNGLGQLARPSDGLGGGSPRVSPTLGVDGTIELINEIQRHALDETRLGIPVLFHEEALHGYAALGATSFPMSIALASSFDPDLVREVNSVIAREVRARGVPFVLSPVVDIVRDPRWGRIEETFGEDPFLVGEIGVAAVEGLQGVGRISRLGPDKVFATLKHMTGHGHPESGTNIGPAPISERELRENFFPPFEALVTRTGIAAVMPSYNEIDGVPSHANRWLLEDVLRREWGFEGVVVSDYYAIGQMVSLHRAYATNAEAAIVSLETGVDIDLPNGAAYSTLVESVRAGRVDESLIDRSVRRVLDMKFRAGLFEEPFADARRARSITNNAEARALARRAAERSIVLLENDGLLPLPMPARGEDTTIAVIGPNAAVARLGGYSGQPPSSVSLLEGIREKLGNRANVVYAEGVSITVSDDWWADAVEQADRDENLRKIEEAVAVARDADLIVLALGDTEQTSREGWADNHLGDRASLDLVGEQQALFDAMHALGKPIAVVLINGRPASTVEISEKANALIEAWYPGEQGGHAMADVLFGDVNPGGKLPVTFARNVGQLPVYYNHKPSARRGYLFDTYEPLYPFGYGLSYTTFRIGSPRLSSLSIGIAGRVNVEVEVTNTGSRRGDETVQLYIRDVRSSVTRPVRELKGFERITLEPGETRTVSFDIGPEHLRFWNERMERVVEPGEFEIMVGPNSVELQSATLTVGARP